MKKRAILISGAGIGGLTAALCLQKSGHDVVVCEQQSSLPTSGAGLQLGANALRVFDYLGILDEVRASAVQPEKVLFREHVSGESLYEMTLGDRYIKRYGLPYLHVHRADLLAILAHHWSQKGTIRFNTRLTAFKESESGVWAEINNEQNRFDLLVGADGIRSACRERLFGNQAPRFTGNMAWRATVPASALPQGWMDTIASNFVGPGKHAVLYYVRNREIANFVGVVERTQPMSESSRL